MIIGTMVIEYEEIIREWVLLLRYPAMVRDNAEDI